MVQGVSISLLELNTLAHAVCALFIYGIWWQKPQESSGTFVLHGQGLSNLVALALIEQPTKIVPIRIRPIVWSIRHGDAMQPSLDLKYVGRRGEHSPDKLYEIDSVL